MMANVSTLHSLNPSPMSRRFPRDSSDWYLLNPVLWDGRLLLSGTKMKRDSAQCFYARAVGPRLRPRRNRCLVYSFVWNHDAHWLVFGGERLWMFEVGLRARPSGSSDRPLHRWGCPLCWVVDLVVVGLVVHRCSGHLIMCRITLNYIQEYYTINIGGTLTYLHDPHLAIHFPGRCWLLPHASPCESCPPFGSSPWSSSRTPFRCKGLHIAHIY